MTALSSAAGKWAGASLLFRRQTAALLDAASPLVPSNGGADMVRASALACNGDFLLGLAGCEGKDLIAQGGEVRPRAAVFCGPSAPT